jgi:hypothetical protein
MWDENLLLKLVHQIATGDLYCDVYGWYSSQIRGLLRQLIGFITTSVTLAHLITIIYQQYSAIADLHRYNSPLLTH